jgi:putative flippase GtrA
MIKPMPENAKQFIKYLFIGALNFITDLSVLIFLVEVLKLNVSLAATLSYICGLVVHFNLNRYWNFKNFQRNYYQHLRTYLVATLIFYSFYIVIINIFLFAGFYYILAKVLASGILACLTFLFNKYITFSVGIRTFFKNLMIKNDKL